MNGIQCPTCKGSGQIDPTPKDRNGQYLEDGDRVLVTTGGHQYEGTITETYFHIRGRVIPYVIVEFTRKNGKVDHVRTDPSFHVEKKGVGDG